MWRLVFLRHPNQGEVNLKLNSFKLKKDPICSLHSNLQIEYISSLLKDECNFFSSIYS